MNVVRYVSMIVSLADAVTEDLWINGKSRKIPASIHRVALRKLAHLHFAGRLDDLRAPPGNRLEALGGDRKGQHSIRINHHWRICFIWRDGDAWEVHITDYH